jgi:hypothetical protein
MHLTTQEPEEKRVSLAPESECYRAHRDRDIGGGSLVPSLQGFGSATTGKGTTSVVPQAPRNGTKSRRGRHETQRQPSRTHAAP